ncbi:MAG: hypothetical protein QXP91_11265 [Candidatus Methanomethylicia archaeon]
MGEPTLNLEIGSIAESIREFLGGDCPPIAILTNSSLTFRDDVRRNLSTFDLVIAKLDASDNELFNSINRPVAGIELSSIISGLRRLKIEAKGKLTCQTMLLRDSILGIDNTRIENVNSLINTIKAIEFNEVFLNTPWRPPYEKHVEPLDSKKLDEIAKIFRIKLPGVEVNCYKDIKQVKVERKTKPISMEDILLLLRRRPCRFMDLAAILGLNQYQLKMLDNILNRLIKEKKIEIQIHHGENSIKLYKLLKLVELYKYLHIKAIKHLQFSQVLKIFIY